MVANSFAPTARLPLPRLSFRVLWTVVSLLATVRRISSTLKMEAIRSSETSVYKNPTRCHIPVDSILHSNIPSLYPRAARLNLVWDMKNPDWSLSWLFSAILANVGSVLYWYHGHCLLNPTNSFFISHFTILWYIWCEWPTVSANKLTYLLTYLPRGLSPQANYTDRATASCWRS
jgi:hypothetical protein